MKKNFITAALAACAFGFTACSDDNDGPSYASVPMGNSALMEVLKAQGYEFNEQNQLLLNDKAMSTDSLNLSATGLTDFTGLDQLPKLRAVSLQANNYEKEFDFSTLPSQITSVDLRGNDIFELKGLANTDNVEANGYEATNVLHNLSRLYLPVGVKYDPDQTVAFYKKQQLSGNKVDMQLADSAGIMSAYTTLRAVPDAKFRQYLYEGFSQVFTITAEGDTMVDVSKRFISPQQRSTQIGPLFDPTTMEGFQYVWDNPSYIGTMLVVRSGTNVVDLPYLKMGPNAAIVHFNHVNFSHGLDLSKATGIYHFEMYSCKGMKTLDLSASTKFGQRDLKTESTDTDVSMLLLDVCDDIEEIKLPEKAYMIQSCQLVYLPKLKELDLSHLETFRFLDLGALDICKIKYPTVQYATLRGQKVTDGTETCNFGVWQDVFDKSETKQFIKDNMKLVGRGSISMTDWWTFDLEQKSVEWDNIYKKNPW